MERKSGVKMYISQFLRVVWWCGVGVGLIGCGSKPEVKTRPSLVAATSKPLEQIFDLNRDGKEDAWRYFKEIEGERVIQKKEFDLNFDGKVDFRRFYSKKGILIREEMDPYFLGVFTLKTYYEDQKLIRKERSLEGDERPEVFKYYKKGVMYYLEHDRNADGVLDGWEYYREGQLVRLGFDRDGDGQPDFWKELD